MEPMLGVTLSPTMISASQKKTWCRRCSVMVDCRVPPGFGGDHVRRRVTELLGSERESEYSLRFADEVVGNSSPLQGELADAVREFVQQQDADAGLIPLVLPGFTDSHWFRKAFPECIAYGFFPQRAMGLFDTTPLVHGADERIAVDDIELAARFYNTLAPRLLG